MCKCNIIYSHNSSMAFPVLIFMELANTEQPYMQISYANFQPSQRINVESMDSNLFMPLIKAYFSLCLFLQNS